MFWKQDENKICDISMYFTSWREQWNPGLFWKNLKRKISQNFKKWFWTQKWPIYPIWIISFLLKSKAATFTESQVQFQKNLMSRFRENLKSVDFGPKFYSFLIFFAHKKNSFKVCVRYFLKTGDKSNLIT